MHTFTNNKQKTMLVMFQYIFIYIYIYIFFFLNQDTLHFCVTQDKYLLAKFCEILRNCRYETLVPALFLRSREKYNVLFRGGKTILFSFFLWAVLGIFGIHFIQNLLEMIKNIVLAYF